LKVRGGGGGAPYLRATSPSLMLCFLESPGPGPYPLKTRHRFACGYRVRFFGPLCLAPSGNMTQKSQTDRARISACMCRAMLPCCHACGGDNGLLRQRYTGLPARAPPAAVPVGQPDDAIYPRVSLTIYAHTRVPRTSELPALELVGTSGWSVRISAGAVTGVARASFPSEPPRASLTSAG